MLSWGDYPKGGGTDPDTQMQLDDGVTNIVATDSTALKDNRNGRHGSLMSSRPDEWKYQLNGVASIVATDSAFAALKDDGTFITWGDANGGGDSCAIGDPLPTTTTLDCVSNIYQRQIAAVKQEDSSICSWGNPQFGGDSSSVADQLSNVVGAAAPFDNFSFHPLTAITEVIEINEDESISFTTAQL